MCDKEPFWAKRDKEKWLQLQFNLNFLKEQKIKHGEIHCEYCGKKNLKIYDWCEHLNSEDVATVDHFYPKSKYGELRKNEKNFVISCYNCNNKKSDNLWDIKEIKFPINKEKIEELKIII
jgi:5-methylcytosine-specific restriction endonuclease McrA